MIFNSCSTLMIATLSRYLQRVVMKSSEYIYQQGDIAKSMYLLDQGQVVLLKKPPAPESGNFTVKVIGQKPVKMQMVYRI